MGAVICISVDLSVLPLFSGSLHPYSTAGLARPSGNGYHRSVPRIGLFVCPYPYLKCVKKNRTFVPFQQQDIAFELNRQEGFGFVKPWTGTYRHQGQNPQ
jgi:hypothetical protein